MAFKRNILFALLSLIVFPSKYELILRYPLLIKVHALILFLLLIQ